MVQEPTKINIDASAAVNDQPSPASLPEIVPAPTESIPEQAPTNPASPISPITMPPANPLTNEPENPPVDSAVLATPITETLPNPPADITTGTSPVQKQPEDWRQKVLAGKKQKVEKRLLKILEFVRIKGSISNDEVQKLTSSSDATATRYLSLLVKRGQLVRASGKTKTTRYRTA